MTWRDRLFKKVGEYIVRDIAVSWREPFTTWWVISGPQILNEFEEILDQETRAAVYDELGDLSRLIELEPAINSEDCNVVRIQGLIKIMADENLKPTDYTNPEDGASEIRGVTPETDPRIIDALRPKE